MIIKLKGETSLNKLPQIIKEVTADITARAGIEGANFKVKDAELGLVFKVGEELKYLTVEHDGLAEIFQVNVQLDDRGNIARKVDNEENSFVDEYSRAVSKGLDSQINKPIESSYSDEELIQEKEESVEDLTERLYRVKDSSEDERVLRYYRNGILVGEMGYMQKKGSN